MTPFSTDSPTNAALTEALVHYSMSSTPESMSPPTSKLSCSLRWRQGKLWVSTFLPSGSVPLPALASEEWFRACLLRSQAQAVVVDPELGDASINLWLKACQEAGKPMYLRIPSMASLPQKKKKLTWLLKRVCDRIFAALLLFLLSLILLTAIGVTKLRVGEPIFDTQWRVGERGKLFRVLRWRSEDFLVAKALNAVLQLLNVLRGEMSLVGPRAWIVQEAVKSPPNLHHRLNALPGITGSWRLKRQSQSDRFLINQQDLAYLEKWTFIDDLKLLLISTSKVPRS